MPRKPIDEKDLLLAWFHSDCHEERVYRDKKGQERCVKCRRPCQSVDTGQRPAAFMKRKQMWGLNKVEPKE